MRNYDALVLHVVPPDRRIEDRQAVMPATPTIANLQRVKDDIERELDGLCQLLRSDYVAGSGWQRYLVEGEMKTAKTALIEVTLWIMELEQLELEQQQQQDLPQLPPPDQPVGSDRARRRQRPAAHRGRRPSRTEAARPELVGAR